MAPIRWRHMEELGQEHILLPRGAVSITVSPPMVTTTISPAASAVGVSFSRSFFARLTVPLLLRPVR